MFFTLLIATIAFTASTYHHICHRHSLYSFILQQSSPVIVWARLAPFTDIAILTDVGRITTSQLTSQQRYTLLRPSVMSHRHPVTCHTHPTCVFTSITTPSPLFVLLVSVQRIAEPLGLVVASVMSQSHLSHCLRFWVLLLCTALIERLSAHHRHNFPIPQIRPLPLTLPVTNSASINHAINSSLSGSPPQAVDQLEQARADSPYDDNISLLQSLQVVDASTGNTQTPNPSLETFDMNIVDSLDMNGSANTNLDGHAFEIPPFDLDAMQHSKMGLFHN